MISFTLLQHIVLVQGILLAVSLGLFFAHRLWLAWYGRRYQPLLERTQATIDTVVLGGTALPPTEYEWLCALPVRLQIRLFTHLAPSLSGAKKQQLTELAHALGLLARAATRCRSQWWWRRLQGARLFTLLGGGEHVVPLLFLDRAALVRAQAAEWAVEHPTPAVINALLLLLGDAESLCRLAAQDALVVPTVFDADRKSVGQIARDARALAERVRAGVITPPELSSGTFTVSNLGMYGISNFHAVINTPQAGILAVGEVKAKPVVSDSGEIVARRLMGVTLACDHRILYGADAAEFLARIRALLEEPLSLAL